MLPCKILIIDDDETIKFSFKTFLSNDENTLLFGKNGKEGLEQLTNSEPDIVIADYKMPEMSGLEFLKASKIIAPKTPVIIMSAYGDNATKQTFLNENAHHYIEKPFDIEEIISLINNTKAKLKTSSDSKIIRSSEEFIGESPKIKTLFSNIKKINETSISVLIEGESGTGKDIIAQHIHNNSINKNGPFICINCAAIPENLIESELFGYEKGAFTGADLSKEGKFEIAQNGTIFLDEIGELNLQVQAKLLRILQNKSYERIGSNESIETNARVIAATNQPLQDLIEKNGFRKDLYYRLSSFPIHIPSLRDRKSDISLIANYFLNHFCIEFNKKNKSLTEEAMNALENYEWPGNVRELQNILSRVTLLESSQKINEKIIQSYLPDKKNIINNDASLTNIINYSEKELLNLHAIETYKACYFNKAETAKKLGINYRTLMKRLNEIDIS